MDCGFKFFRREAVDGIALYSNSAMITTELMARLAGRNARICEVDVTHLPRVAGEQTGNSPMVVLHAFSGMFALYRDLKTARLGETPVELVAAGRYDEDGSVHSDANWGKTTQSVYRHAKFVYRGAGMRSSISVFLLRF